MLHKYPEFSTMTATNKETLWRSVGAADWFFGSESPPGLILTGGSMAMRYLRCKGPQGLGSNLLSAYGRREVIFNKLCEQYGAISAAVKTISAGAFAL